MMRMREVGSLVLTVLLAAAPILRAQEGVIANELGQGVMTLDVSDTADPDEITQLLENNLELNGAEIKSITVENGQATIEFVNAVPGAEVTATLPANIAEQIGLVAAGFAGQYTTGVIIGGVVLVATGTSLGIAAGVGAFDSDENLPVTGER